MVDGAMKASADRTINRMDKRERTRELTAIIVV
jgi:hypothetical protein